MTVCRQTRFFVVVEAVGHILVGFVSVFFLLLLFCFSFLSFAALVHVAFFSPTHAVCTHHAQGHTSSCRCWMLFLLPCLRGTFGARPLSDRGRSIGRSVVRLVDWSVGRSVGWSVGRSVGRSVFFAWQGYARFAQKEAWRGGFSCRI